jgi:hypothetical protein
MTEMFSAAIVDPSTRKREGLKDNRYSLLYLTALYKGYTSDLNQISILQPQLIQVKLLPTSFGNNELFRVNTFSVYLII